MTVKPPRSQQGGFKPMTQPKISPQSYEQAWDLLKFRLAEKTSWGRKEILAVMTTIEALLLYEKRLLSKRLKRRLTYGKEE